MEFLRLRYLLVAAEELNVRRAAKRLGVTQPALTRQIAALELELGFDVLLRHQQRLVWLTRSGERFVEDARRILRELEDAANAGRAIARGAVGRVRIGLCEESLGGKLATMLRGSRMALPKVDMAFCDMASAAQLGALHGNSIDLGVLVVPADAGGLAIDPLWHEGKAVALPEAHALAERYDVSIGAGTGPPIGVQKGPLSLRIVWRAVVFLGLADRAVSSSRPDLPEALRAAAVKDGRRPSPEAARSVLDGGEHCARLDRMGCG